MPAPAEATGASADRDATTLDLLLARNPDGLRHLIEDHGSRTLAALRRTFGHVLAAGELEDAFTSALVRIWSQPGSFGRGRGTLRAWLFVVARNQALTLVRRRQRRERNVTPGVFEDLVADLAPTRNEQDRLRRVADLHGCLAELPQLQRAVLQADLAAHGTAPTEELARQLATTARVIYAARHRGRAELARMMQRLGHFVDRPIRRTVKKEAIPHVE